MPPAPHACFLNPLRALVTGFAALALLIAAPVSSANAACGVLKLLDGNWSGKGRMKRNATAKNETARCRVRFTWNAAASQLSQSIKCHGTSGGFTATGALMVSGNRLNGSYSTGRRATARGSCGARSLTLNFRGKDKKGKPVRSRFSLSISGGGKRMRNSIRATDGSGRQFQALNATFRK